MLSKRVRRTTGCLVGAMILVGSILASSSRSAAIGLVLNELGDPLSIFDARSPGRRSAGELKSSKTAYGQAHKAKGPKSAAPSAEEDAPIKPGLVPAPATPQFVGGIPLVGSSGGDNAPAGFGGNSGGGGGYYGGGSGGGVSQPLPGSGTEPTGMPSEPPNPLPTPVPPIVTPVPEPATWAMMVVGLGAAGWAMRRQRSFYQPDM